MRVRIQLVTQMWPGPSDPDFGSFLVPLRDRFEAAGHQVGVSAITTRGGRPHKYAGLLGRAIADARRTRPEVVFAHMLFPAGAVGVAAARASGAALVVMAHGQDVANIGHKRGVGAATARVLGRADAVIANSAWLGAQLRLRSGYGGPLEVIDCGVDLDAFAPRDQASARAELGWGAERTAFVCVGSLIERKNVVGLADAFARFGRGSLAFVGDGPLRSALAGREGVHLAGRIDPTEVPRWVAACDVLCQPSLIEPFGQATLEGMAMERSVIATKLGGPPEFVDAEAGILIDPTDPDALLGALQRAAAMPAPNPAARAAAARHDVNTQAARMLAVLGAAIKAFDSR